MIITGLKTKHRSYARAVAHSKAGEDEPPEELETLEKEVLSFFNSKGIPLQSERISACYTFCTSARSTKPVIVVRFVNGKHKTEMLQQAKRLKGADIYINEHLTKKNADIARHTTKRKKDPSHLDPERQSPDPAEWNT